MKQFPQGNFKPWPQKNLYFIKYLGSVALKMESSSKGFDKRLSNVLTANSKKAGLKSMYVLEYFFYRISIKD